MRRFLLALRVFFRTLLSSAMAQQVDRLLAGEGTPGGSGAGRQPVPKPPPDAMVSRRNDAITLLAALQREARFVDFVKEPLAGYSDAQIGVVARDVHRGCAEVLERLFALAPVRSESENDPMEVPPGFDPGRCQLTGNVTGEPPFQGRLVHRGWQATACNVGIWSGSDAAAPVVAPAEVELT